MKYFFIFIFSFLIVCSNGQTYSKLYENFAAKLDTEDVKDEVIISFMKKYEKDLEKNKAHRSTLYNRLGVRAYNQQFYGDAKNYYINAFNDGYAAGDTVAWGFAQYNLAFLYNHIGYYPQAEQMFQQALPIMARVYGASSEQYTKMYRVLTQMYVEMGYYKEAKPMNDAILYYFKTLKGERDREYLIALNTEAQIAQGLGDYKKAIEIFNRLIKIHGSIDPVDTTDYITTLNNGAEAYRLSGNYDQALKLLNLALRLSHKFKEADKISTATVYNNSGLCYKAIGDYKRAEICYDSCMYLYRSLDLANNPDYTNSLNNKADMYRILGRYQQATDLLSEVIQIRKNTTGKKHFTYANALTNVALLYDDQYRYAEAEPYLLQAKEIYKETVGEDHQYYANCIHNLSLLYCHLKRYKDAETYSKIAIESIKGSVGEEHERYAYFLSGLSGIYERQQKYEEAISCQERSNAIIKKKFGEKHTAYIDGVFSVASLKWLLKDYKKAKELFNASLFAYKAQFDNFFYAMSEREQLSFYSVVGQRFEDFNTFVFDYAEKFPKENHAELFNTCFNFQMFIKSLLLNNNVNSRREILSSKDTAMVNLYNRWSYIKQQLSEHYRDIATEDNMWNISDLEIEADKLEQTLKNKTSLFSQNKVISFSEIKSKLKPNEAAINIIRAQKFSQDTNFVLEYAAFIITKNSTYPILTKIAKSKDFETIFVKEYSDNIENRKPDKLSYDRFWKQFTKHLNGITKVYISPDGIYNQVNLYTLQNPITEKYVLDEVDLCILPNLNYLLQNAPGNLSKTAELYGYPDYEFDFTMQKKQDQPNQMVAVNRFGFSELPPLPGTKTEVENISVSLQNNDWKINTFTEEKASEQQLKKTGSPKVLHIATHGFFLKNVEDSEDETILGFEASKLKSNPLLRSGIMMAGASIVARDTLATEFEQDGIFTAYEASLLNLVNTDLVVLSACETGLGVDINNQGVFGLQRAFYIAGAKNLIMSLWVVDDDATQILMSEFYKEWALNPAKENISRSFKKAQAEVRKKYPHPYYWGAFTLLGN
jgi:CHAT domain-containing protein